MPRRVTQVRVGRPSDALAYLFRIVLVPARALLAERAHGAVYALPQHGIRPQRDAAILANNGGSCHSFP